jgi:ubiquitin C-terminal hydrolase
VQKILSRLQVFSDKDQKFYNKVYISAIIRTIYVFAGAKSSKSLYEQAEKTEMSISLQLLRSKFLDKRVKGMNNIADALERAVLPGEGEFVWFKEGEMIAWLKGEKVVETVLTDRPHIEVLKRSQPVFSFLAERGQLSAQDLEELWDSTVDKHESYVRTVYDLVTSLAAVLPKELLTLIYEKLRKIDLAQSQDFIIIAMKNFTRSAAISLKRQFTDTEPFCLTEFQSFLSSSDANPALIPLVQNAIVELLSTEEFEAFRQSTLKAFFSAGDQVRSITIVLRLLRELPIDACKDFLSLQDSALVPNIITWIVTTVKANKPEEELKIYLELLETVLAKGVATKLEDQELQQLWQELTSEDCNLQHTKVFFRWLQSCAEASDLSIKLFEHYLCRIPPGVIQRLPLEAYACFQTFFLYVNGICHNLKAKDDCILSRSAEQLYGQDTLINFILHTKEESVVLKGIRMVAQLHTRVLKEADAGIVSKFVLKRLEALIDLHISQSGEDVDLQTSRNLSIITGIIDAHDYIVTGKQYLPEYREWCSAYYRLPDESSWKVLSTNKSATLGSLRKGIAYFNTYEADCVKLEYSGTAYTFVDDERVLGKLGHPLHFTVRYEIHDFAFVNVADIIGDHEDSQHLLFMLISKPEKLYKELIWSILSRITSNRLIQLKIKELGATYLTMMDSRSFHKQLFCLTVLSQLNKTDGFDGHFKTYRKNDLFRVLARDAELGNGELVEYFAKQDAGLVLHYAQLMLELMHAFRDNAGASCNPQVINHVLDLLFLYAKNVTEDSETPQPSMPDCAWRIILDYWDSNWEGLRDVIGNYKHLEMLMFYSLQQAKNLHFSEQMKEFLTRASGSPLDLFTRISGILMSSLSDAINSTKTTKEYFSLLSKLSKRQSGVDYSQSFALLLDFLKSRSPEEHAKSEDKGLTGALKLMRAMVSKCPQLSSAATADYLLQTCLIDVQGGVPKCKSTVARLAGFKLLATLCDDAAAREVVLAALQPFQRDLSWRKGKLAHWLHSFNPYEKSKTGFVGIRNLGATCYMNSMLQQLYMIHSFSQGLYECEVIEDHESCLFHLQKIFVGLAESDKMYIQAKGLCAAYKNWEGQSLNPHEQMDTDEFFNGLMDKLEEALKGTNRPKLVEEHFRGILTHQCIGKGNCAHRSERDEPFLTIPLEIKNKRSIIDSLEALTVGEVLEGDNAYACDYCNAKVTAKRRLCIRSLPNVLIFTLRRFDFDMDTMNRVKLNNFCEFPMTLNMEPYTIEGVSKRDAGKETAEEAEAASPSGYDAAYYQYSLKGIIVHLGYAEAGHYYSFILDHKSGKWFEFNDINVDPFNSDQIPTECFGVMEKITGGLSHEEGGKLRNAYILLYERTAKYQVKGKDDPVPIPLVISAENQISPSCTALQNKIHASNLKYSRKKRLFSPEYSHFVLSLTLKSIPDVRIFTLSHYLTVQIRCKEPALDIMRALYSQLGEDSNLSLWFLEQLSYEPLLRELLLENPLNEMRKFIVALADKSLKTVDSDAQRRILHRLMAAIPKLPQRLSTQTSGYFELLYRLALVNSEAVEQAKLAVSVLNLVLKREITSGDEQKAETFNKDIGLGRENDPIVASFPAPAANSPLNYTFQIALLNVCLDHLTAEESDLLTSNETIGVLLKGVQGKFGANQTARLYQRLISTKGPEMFTVYSRSLLKELKSSDYEQHRPLLVQLKRLITSSDPESLAVLLQGLLDVLLSQLMYIRATESVLHFLHRLCLRHRSTKQWLYDHIAQLSPLTQWKQKYQTWTSQASNGLYLTKVYSALASFTEYHPSPHLILKLASLLGCKVPDMPKDVDSDDDLYETTLKASSLAEYGAKEETNYKVEIVASFLTGYYVRYDGYESDRIFFLPADDDRLMPVSAKSTIGHL